jgi:L-rhamnose mutarotase
MQRVASIMKLLPGNEEEYERRHREIWPDLVALLKEKDIHRYSIFLDKNTSQLFAFLESEDEVLRLSLAGEEIMKKWWFYMNDIMETNEDNSPVATLLQEVFFLP